MSIVHGLITESEGVLLKTKWRDRLQATVVTVFADTTMEDLLGKSGILRAASNVVAAVNTSIEGKVSGRVPIAGYSP